ncbi:MAG: hypothetical protein K2X98_00605 [Alphaproteobacteria bacterium]|nr:hypothetical protein [Alphaproteobacteria bacterium]
MGGFYLVKKITKSNTASLLPLWFVAFALFFSYGPLIDSLGFLIQPYIKVSYLWLIVSAGVMYCVYKASSYDAVQTIVKVLIVVVCGMPLIGISMSYADKLFFHTHGEESHDKKVSSFEFEFIKKPNIYYILVDGYARQDTLKETLNYDNEPFLKELEELGFAVSRQARSNYHFTGASLSATMNMMYHTKDKEDEIRYDQMHESLKGDNSVRKILRKNGYTIVNMPAHWHQMDCYGNEDVCLRKRGFEVYQSFLSSTPFRFLRFKNNYVDPNQIKEIVHNVSKKPKYVFAHLAQVHDAIYAEDGAVLDALHPIYSNHENGKNYLYSIRTMNKKLLDMVTSIIKNDKDSIIIMQADHGPTYVAEQLHTDPQYWLAHNDELRLVSKNTYTYTFGVLSAVYVSPLLKNTQPINDYFSGKLSLVNTFRYLFSWLSNKKPNLLGDESHFLYMNDKTKNYNEQDIENFK